MSNTTKPALLVMAAGMGSRYGGIKQIDGFGPSGETIMDYSLFDCIREGFGQVVFVVREEILDTVRNMFLPKLQGKVRVDFVIQSLDKFVPPAYQPVNRKKPWGTTHAMLCGREVITGPFAVINADDFYGREAFASLAEFFKTAQPHEHAMVGYTLKNVLSDHGSVSRGVAQADAAGFLVSMTEHTTIVHEHGKIISKLKDDAVVLDSVAPVSMNCWGFQAEVFDLAEKMFHNFVAANHHNPGAEFYIALLVTELIERQLGKVKILPGGKTWFGVTYQEDKQAVAAKIRDLVHRGEYPQKLW